MILACSFGLNVRAMLFKASPTHKAQYIGQDLWCQLKCVEIPVFSGDKRSYQSTKTAFIACNHNAPATAECMLLHLQEYLPGEALQAIKNLGHAQKQHMKRPRKHLNGSMGANDDR